MNRELAKYTGSWAEDMYFTTTTKRSKRKSTGTSFRSSD
jgi:hypothetical protein